jgi:flagellar basal-body rod protein FlgB
MLISDIPILSMLRTRMQWHQERQRVLAENVANADTPNYRARDLEPLNFEHALTHTASLGLDRTSPAHISATGTGSQFAEDKPRYEVRPRGTSVSHEDEMLKLAGNQMDYDAVTSLYTHSLALIKTAVGKS